MRNFGTKNTLFWYIAAGLSKQYLLIWNQHSPICQTMKLCKGIKMSKFGIKNTLFGYFEAGIWKEICLIWVQHLRLCLIGKFQETTTCLIWEFLSWNLKKQCSHSSNKHPWYFILKKVCEKMKMPKFGTKKSAPTNSHFICVFLGWNLKTILSYLKSASWNLSNRKNSGKKCLSLGTKIRFSGIFGMKFENNVVIFEISTLEFV